jgi:putative lipoprotein
MVGLNTGCTDKKPEALTDTLAIDTDTIADTTHADTIARIVEETPMPKAADQLFDDFFFNFIANRRLQRARIVFPLPVTRGGKTKMLQKSQWKTEHFFMRQQYYTLIFDNEQQMDNAKSTSLDSVVVEKIYLREGLVDQYAFGHGDGKWRMERINQISFKDNVNASFLNFLQKFFAANGAGMIRNPLPYSGPDPNGEETSHVETTIPAEEWSTFLPTVPDNMIYNILYGQKYGKSQRKILVFRGLSNGIETRLVFKQRHGKWRLEKIKAY